MEPEGKYSIKFTPKLLEIVEDQSNHSKPKDMEETWAETDKEPDSTNDSPHVTCTPEEIAARNASMIETMKKNVPMFRDMRDNNNNSGTQHGNTYTLAFINAFKYQLLFILFI